jgi:21S rRNA (GM2251-2'-O)-methyltransferase
MVYFFLLRSSRNFAHTLPVLHRCYHAGKAGAVHTAIQRGLRKSRGQGFRGSHTDLAADDPREKYRVEHGISKYENQPTEYYPRNGYGHASEESSPAYRTRKLLNDWEKRGRVDTRDFKKRSSGERTRDSTNEWEARGKTEANELRIRLGKRLIAGKDQENGGNSERPARSGPSYEEISFTPTGRRLRDSGDRLRPGSTWEKSGRSVKHGRSDVGGSKFDGRPEQRSGSTSSYFKGSTQPSGSARDSPSRTPVQAGRERDSVNSSARRSGTGSDAWQFGSGSFDPRIESNGSNRYPSLSFKKKLLDSTNGNISSREGSTSERHPGLTSFGRGSRYDSNASSANAHRDERSATSGPKFTQVADSRIPLSIPYTTPASEFLYGTSVVEAALSSRREPRRKLYKLYIYNGENREDPDQDARLERLARRSGVDVVRAGNDWLRVMDKMSAGRPHNGYILEASPLPRLPVTSLGQLTTVDGQDGFEVSIDHQSREEAAVNGTSNFIKIPRSRHGRKPLVLLLDSIVDPGNLGAIIRTSAFLGVTAIAISSRNSASFTPVVLKASAGASEDITLFMVNKPAGFVVDSKNAGWKVFAAVAPAKKHDPAMPISLSTDQLNDPLSEDPCILMLGSEGEGLRWNLRSKADADLYIEGSNQSHNVDSLNVSVAAGILCTTFLKRSKPKQLAPIRQAQDEVIEVPETAKLF